MRGRIIHAGPFGNRSAYPFFRDDFPRVLATLLGRAKGRPKVPKAMGLRTKILHVVTGLSDTFAKYMSAH